MEKHRAARALLAAGEPLGLLAQDPEIWLRRAARAVIDEAAVNAFIEARAAARKARNFSEADRLRASLLAEGIILEDTPAGTTWRRA